MHSVHFCRPLNFVRISDVLGRGAFFSSRRSLIGTTVPYRFRSSPSGEPYMRLQPLSARRCHAILVIAMVFAVLPCSIATAGPILLKFDVAFLAPGSPSAFDLGVAVTGAVEINNAGGTNVGAPFFDDEFIDITSNASMTSLAYMLQGGLNPHLNADYSTSWPFGYRYPVRELCSRPTRHAGFCRRNRRPGKRCRAHSWRGRRIACQWRRLLDNPRQ